MFGEESPLGRSLGARAQTKGGSWSLVRINGWVKWGECHTWRQDHFLALFSYLFYLNIFTLQAVRLQACQHNLPASMTTCRLHCTTASSYDYRSCWRHWCIKEWRTRHKTRRKGGRWRQCDVLTRVSSERVLHRGNPRACGDDVVKILFAAFLECFILQGFKYGRHCARRQPDNPNADFMARHYFPTDSFMWLGKRRFTGSRLAKQFCC